jgi:histidine triad (HIT) family protein
LQARPECIFCRILEGTAEASIVFRGREATAFMDLYPVTPGHVLVVPNRHAANLKQLDQVSEQAMFHLARQIALAIRGSGLPCEGINLFLADGGTAGQTVFHSHLHVIPRFSGDGFRLPPVGPPGGARRQVLDQQAQRIAAALAGLQKDGEAVG